MVCLRFIYRVVLLDIRLGRVWGLLRLKVLVSQSFPPLDQNESAI